MFPLLPLHLKLGRRTNRILYSMADDGNLTPHVNQFLSCTHRYGPVPHRHALTHTPHMDSHPPPDWRAHRTDPHAPCTHQHTPCTHPARALHAPPRTQAPVPRPFSCAQKFHLNLMKYLQVARPLMMKQGQTHYERSTTRTRLE